MDIVFGNSQPAQPTQPQQPATPVVQGGPGNLPPQEGVVTDGTVPGAAPAENVSDNPMAQYEGLWDTDPNAPPAIDTTGGFQEVDPTKLQGIVSKASFTNGITPEMKASIVAGGEPAVEAFTQALDTVARQVMTHATLTANQMAKKAVESSVASQQANLPNMLKQHNVLNANPLFSNPSIKPVADAVQQQLAAKFPDSSADDIATMTQDFIITMGEQFAPKPATPAGEQEEFDFNTFLTP